MLYLLVHCHRVAWASHGPKLVNGHIGRTYYNDGSNCYLVTEEPGSVFVTTA